LFLVKLIYFRDVSEIYKLNSGNDKIALQYYLDTRYIQEMPKYYSWFGLLFSWVKTQNTGENMLTTKTCLEVGTDRQKWQLK